MLFPIAGAFVGWWGPKLWSYVPSCGHTANLVTRLLRSDPEWRDDGTFLRHATGVAIGYQGPMRYVTLTLDGQREPLNYRQAGAVYRAARFRQRYLRRKQEGERALLLAQRIVAMEAPCATRP